MSYIYLSTESDADDTNEQPDKASSEPVSLSAAESPMPTHQGHPPIARPIAWIVVAVSAVTCLVGLSLFAFFSTSTALPDETVLESPAQQSQHNRDNTAKP